MLTYKVLYKGFNGGYLLSDEMTFDNAQKFKQKCLDMGYTEVHIIQVVD